MPYAENQGVRIHYHVEGDGPPLVLQHGLTASLEGWYDAGYVEALKGDYRLILVDARGHGASDKPHFPEAYDMKLMAGDVVAVLDDLNVRQAHYWGYSMGGTIGFNTAKYHPEHLHSLIIGGAHPYAQDLEDFRQIFKEGNEALVASWEQEFGTPAPALEARLLANDAEALLAVVANDWPDVSDVLTAMKIPCLLYVGGADEESHGMKDCAKDIPNATFVSLPGLDHIQASFRSYLVLPHVTRFLQKVGRSF
ncbi:MAG: alpha/beta fold hydrolase [Dehalococcoidia bacterium]